MSKKIPLILLGLLVLVAASTVVWHEYYRPFVRTNDAQIDGFKVAVSSDISARIIKLYVDEGDYVKAGDLIADMDDTIPQSQKVEAEAKIMSLKASVMLEEFHLEKVRNDFERAVKGFEEGVTTAQQLDHAQKNFAMAKSKLEMTKADLEHAITQLGVIETILTHTKVWAHIDGKIVKRWVYEGDVMAAGQAMFSLYDLKDVWVLANLEETKMENVKIGDEVEIHVDAYPDKTFQGKIFVIKGAAASEFSLIPQDNATGNYTKVAQRVPLKITVEGAEGLYLFPGMSAEVKIKVAP
ncbi:MAG: HlyD family secretion protein [Verrucomicrobia bacterium]|nr:HlyD family secretion protein [Verrucomicrobiota bacterium]